MRNQPKYQVVFHLLSPPAMYKIFKRINNLLNIFLFRHKPNYKSINSGTKNKQIETNHLKGDLSRGVTPSSKNQV